MPTQKKKPGGPNGAPLPGEDPQANLDLESSAAAPDADAPVAAKPSTDDETPFGIAKPSSSEPDAWLKYDEDVYKAKEKADTEAAAADAERVAAAEAAKPAPKPPEKKPDAKPPVEAKADDKKPPADDIDKLAPPPSREPQTHKALPAEEKFALAEGVEWQRSDLIQSIGAGRAWQAEGENFRKLFGAEYATIEKNWKPWIADLIEHGQPLATALDQGKRDFLDSLDDPEYASFMQANRERWQAWKASEEGQSRAPARRDATPPVNIEANKRIDQLERQLASITGEKRNEELGGIIRAEETKLKTSYGFLNDPQIWNYVWRTAVSVGQEQASRNNGVSNYTLTDCVRDNWPLITRMAKASTDGPSRGSQVDTPPALRSSGAAPGAEAAGAASRNGRTEEKSFESPEAAVDDWLRQYPNGYTGI